MLACCLNMPKQLRKANLESSSAWWRLVTVCQDAKIIWNMGMQFREGFCAFETLTR
ncbi:hypothetical protein Syun_021415 [Stephania yunnanensis]|uniref:Uncharacterized protein n=1 Tax=Stephania yunnanensis TaxID=152371 RepID=A0AAP0IGJ5_9MAGN